MLHGALAFFVFSPFGDEIECRIIADSSYRRGHSGIRADSIASSGSSSGIDRVIVVERMQWHAMTAAPTELGWPGYAVVFETSGHQYDPSRPVKVSTIRFS